MKPLILTAKYGAGHTMVAQAITEAFKTQHIDCTTIDIVKHGWLMEKATSWSYEFMVKNAHLVWKLFYPKNTPNTVRELYKVLVNRKFFDYFDEIRPNTIVCTHNFNTVIALLYKTHHPDIKVYTVITDYVVHPLWIWEGVDTYFVGAEEAKKMIMDNHPVSSKAIIVSGIPLRKGFWKLPSKEETRKTLQLPTDKQIILLSSGSYNSVNLTPLLQVIAQKKNVSVIILANTSRAQKKYEDILAALHISGRVYPHISFIPQVMRSSDLFIGKAGGLSIAESLASGLPLLCVDNMPGQEEGNAEFIETIHAGINTRSIENTAEKLSQLLDQTKKIQSMAQKAEHAGKPQAAQTVVENILRQTI